MTRMAWGAGLTTEAADGSTLDAWFRWLGWGEFGSDEMVADHPDLDSQLGLRDRVDELRRVKVRPIRLTVDVDEAPASAADLYLRLHLLSHRLAAPRTLNLDGAFGLLSNAAWTNLGPVAVADLDDVRLRVRLDGDWLEVHGLDKFPRMTDYVVPSGVRIADADRVRLGACLYHLLDTAAEPTSTPIEGVFCGVALKHFY
jgi:2,3,4,5-tetrahydropyridine-2-carboxylate N-succinyltransferase